MKRSLKRLLGTVLALVLLFSALPAVGAATDIYVGGVAMSEGSYLALGADSVSSTRPDGGYAHYQNGVLTLHDYTYQGSGYREGYYIVRPVKGIDTSKSKYRNVEKGSRPY
jgi:hypothetical protein